MMRYQDAMHRAIALRLRAKNEAEAGRRQALLDLAGEWEGWAAACREAEDRGLANDPPGRPPEDI